MVGRKCRIQGFFDMIDLDIIEREHMIMRESYLERGTNEKREEDRITRAEQLRAM